MASRVDKKEIALAFDRHSGMVFRRARAILGSEDDARDVVQDIFVRAFLEQQRFGGKSELSTWLYRVTTNHCLNVLRNAQRRRGILARHAGADRFDPSPEVMLTIRRLLELSEEQAARAAVYVHIDGMSHREAAEMLDVSRRTVGNLLERFQQRAGEILADLPLAKEEA